MAVSNTVIVRVLGNTKSLTASLKKAQADLGSLERVNRQIGAGFRVAAIGAAVFSAAAVGAGAAGAAALAGIPALIAGIGIAFAATNPMVKKAFSNLKTDVVAQMKGFAEPLVQPLVRTAGALGRAFEVIAPAIQQTFAATAPLINQFNQGLIPVAKQIRPLITQAFAAGVPVLQAFGRAVTPIVGGLRGFFKALEGGNNSAAFTGLVDQLGKSLKQLLPALGRLLTGLAPVGTAILAILVPALVSLSDAIASGVGPAFERLTGIISDHPTLFRNIGLGVLIFVGAVKAATLGIAVYNAVVGAAAAVTGGFSAVMAGAAAVQRVMTAAAIGTRIQLGLLAVQTAVIRAATVAWTAVQWLLNAAMTANPIGLVVLAIAALVAAFVIAYKKSDTFRAIVDKAFSAIKTVVTAAVKFVVNFVKNNWKLLPLLLLGPLGIAVIAVIKNWDKIKSATSAAWNFIKGIVSKVVNAVKAVVMAQFNAIRAVVTAVWNAIKSATTAAWNGIKNAVQTGVNAVLNFVRNLPGQIMGVFAGAGSWLLNAGRQIIQGLLDGITDMIGSVKGKLNELTGLIPDWKGPARVDRKLLRPVGRMIMQGLIKGFEDGRAAIKNTLGKVTDLIEKAMKKSGLSDKVAQARTAKVIKSLDKENKKLLANAKKREAVYKKIRKAQEKLGDLRKEFADYAKGVKDQTLNYTNVAGLGAAFNSDAIAAELKKRLEKVRQFTAVIQDLITKGLNKNMIDQLVQAGVEGGLATATAIAAGGSAAIAELNGLQTDLDKAAGGLGTIAAGSMYDAGIQAAEGLLKGLQTKRKQLEAWAKNIAESMVKALKKTLGIKSPSRVFARLGEQTVQGMEVGLKDLRGVQRATANIGEAMKSSFSKPQLQADAFVGAGSGGGNTYNITVNAGVGDPAMIGKQVTSYIEAYERKGGRRRA